MATIISTLESVAEPVAGQPVNPAGVRQYDVEPVNTGRKSLYKRRDPIYPRRVNGRLTARYPVVRVRATFGELTDSREPGGHDGVADGNPRRRIA